MTNSSGIALLFLSALLAGDDKPAPKVPVGKETTVVTGPLDKYGYINYEAALNERLGKGVTPEKNANVLIWKAIGPRPERGKGMPGEYFKYLGINEPPAKGDYFVGLEQYVTTTLKRTPKEFEAISEQQIRARQRPWAAEDYPHLAAWLNVNEKPLALLIRASERPDYFNPLVSPRDKDRPRLLISALLPSVQGFRDGTGALTVRGMLRVREGKFDEAWQDLLACHRLARLVARGCTLIEGLVGIAIDGITSNTDLAYIEAAGLSAQQVRDRLKDLQALPPLPPMGDKIDLGERFMFLEGMQFVRRGGVNALRPFADEPAPKEPDPKTQQALDLIDWAPAFRSGNQWYSRIVAAMRLTDRAEREKRLEKIDEDLDALKKSIAEPANARKLHPTGEKPDKDAGKQFSDVLVLLAMPAFRKGQHAADRSEQVQRNLYVAFALAAYRLENGRYPAKLGELAPGYLVSVPGDLFSGRALIYRPSMTGYLFYSVGINGKDDGGRSSDDDPPGDDLRVRMPLPEPKPKK